jgi:DNA-binding NarL/FixJ family response regulator
MSDAPATRTAVIVDGHPLWLDALERLLARLDVQVAGKATQAADAEQLITDVRPDLLVSDPSTITPQNGDAAWASWSTVVGRAKKANPDMRCVILSETDDPIEMEQAFAAGADVYCVKRAEPDDLAAAIRQSFEHSIYFARTETAADPARTSAGNGYLAAGLTKRELQILRLVAEGHSNAQLARTLWVTEQTIKFHLSNIYRKLDVANRTEASRWAQLHGVLEEPDGEPAVA